METKIQFIKGLDEKVLPDVRLTRSRDGSTGTATFRFKNPNILDKSTAKQAEKNTQKWWNNFWNRSFIFTQKKQSTAKDSVYQIGQNYQLFRYMLGCNTYGKYPTKFKGFNEPDPSYHGLVFAQALGVGSAFGANLSYIFKIRLQLLRDVGAAVAPFNAWLLAQGLETLSLRIERHIENAKAIATWLEAHPSVSKVNYASLTSSPWNQLAKKYAPKGSGAVLSFELKGGVEAGKKFVESLKLFSHVANIGDVRSLVIHPATTTHSQLSAEEQLAAGVTPGLVRLSLGLENIDDLKADLEIGFAAAK